MGRWLLRTLEKVIMYCKTVGVKSNCVCSRGQDVMTVIVQPFRDVRLQFFSTEGRFLVSEDNNYRHENVDVKRVATEIQENDGLLPKKCFSDPLPSNSFSRWRPDMRFVDATFFRHLYRKCAFCTYFTSDIGALGYQCPHCRRANWPSPGLYIAQTRWPEQPMHSVWYRSAPSSYMVTDDFESYPLSHHKEMCNTTNFLFRRRKFRRTTRHKKTRDCRSPDEVLKKLGKWEDLI